MTNFGVKTCGAVVIWLSLFGACVPDQDTPGGASGAGAASGGCTSNAACPSGNECSGGRCVPFVSCDTGGVACAMGSTCVDGVCRAGCTTDLDCQASGLICNMSTQVCAPAPNPSGSGGGGNASSGADGGVAGSGGTASGGTSGTAGSGGSPPAAGDLIDDFEDADTRIIISGGRQGGWYTYNDASPGQHEVSPAPASVDGSMALHVTGQTTKPEADAYGGVGVDLNNGGDEPTSGMRNAYDVSGFAGVSFRAKGSGSIRVSVITRAVADAAEGGTCTSGCFDSHATSVTLSGSWQEHRVQFSSLMQAGWGTPTAFDGSQVLGLAFERRGAGSYDFYLDDVQLFQSGGGGTGGSGGASGSGGAGGSAGTSGSGGMSGSSGSAGSTACSITGSPNPGQATLTWYHFSQGTYQENGSYVTACGYRGTASGTVDTVQNVANTSPASNTHFVAIPGNSPTDFTNKHYCGGCVEISNGGNRVIATVIDQCPISSNPLCQQAGHLDVSKTAFDKLGYSVGNPSGATWRFVPCPVSGNVVVRIKSGNTDQLYIENTILPIKSVTMNGQAATRLEYGAWDLPGNAAGATLTLTDFSNRTITVSVPGGAAALQNVDTGVQFPACQ
jgi:hypothetical protein